ncbi:MAG: DUF2100 domain-containing protein [Promethearchaeota archaeon]|nr:MAG: DUF2100 domain-containing protein [Candidatus Lokiarchaeota archaeon]
MKTLISEKVKAILAAIDDLIDIKLLIRDIAPNYHLSEKNYKEFISKIESLHNKLAPFFSEYLNDSESHSKKSSENIENLIFDLIKSNKVVLISANASKKKLKNFGLDPRNLIVSGGPLFPEDYKMVNPNLSDSAFINIKKKCKRIVNELKNIDWSNKNLVFLYEKANPTDLLILDKIERISNIIGSSIETVELISWKNLDN